ncbi:MAG: carboxypeptidase Taq [Candidatus Marinamargulisbacteria bacterium]|jgi:carboxypeptidase Taq
MLKKLVDELREISKLNGVLALLHWDQETYMPAGAIQAKSDQAALLSRLIHERGTSKRFKEALGSVVDLESGLVSQAITEGADQCIVREAYRDWKKADKIPADFVSAFSQLTSEAQHIWVQARKADDYAMFSPFLSKLIRMSKEKAAFISVSTPTYDVLLDEFEPGMTAEILTPLFAKLRDGIRGILSEIEPDKGSVIGAQNFPKDKQLSFSRTLLEDIGFDFERGRLDVSAHPFTTNFHSSDVRVTTRFKDHEIWEGITGTIHEGGHGLYEQGLQNDQYDGTPVVEAASLGIHESQSRLWENFIGRSFSFWQFYYPKLKTLFPKQLEFVDLDSFYKELNRVVAGPIRVESDEVTYNLHILIRYEIEQAMFSGAVDVQDLPQLWNQKYQDYLGIVPKSNAEGILQDVHWSSGAFGYFPTYALGNLYASQLFETALEKLPHLLAQIESGNFSGLLEWLNKNVHQGGRSLMPEALIREVTGKGLSETSFLRYLKTKYVDKRC